MSRAWSVLSAANIGSAAYASEVRLTMSNGSAASASVSFVFLPCSVLTGSVLTGKAVLSLRLLRLAAGAAPAAVSAVGVPVKVTVSAADLCACVLLSGCKHSRQSVNARVCGVVEITSQVCLQQDLIAA